MRTRWWRAAHGRTTLPTEEPTPASPYPPAPLSELLHDMQDLRLTLAADLSAAAGATEHGAHDVAGQIVDADRREVAAFRRRAVERLAAMDGVEVPNVSEVTGRSVHPWRKRVLVSLPAVPLAGALAMSAAAAAGLLPVPGHMSHRAPSVHAAAPITSTFDQFEAVLQGDPSESQVLSAATALHRQLAALIASAPQNPAHVREVAHLLQLEQALLMRTQPPGSNVVLAASRQLAATLLELVPHLTQPTSAAVATSQSSTSSKPKAQSTASSTPTSHPTTTPKPSPTATQTPAPTPTPTSTTSYLPGLHN